VDYSAHSTNEIGCDLFFSMSLEKYQAKYSSFCCFQGLFDASEMEKLTNGSGHHLILLLVYCLG